MLGSPNGGRFVYDSGATTSPAKSGVVAELFVRALEEEGLLWQSVAVGASDNVSFDRFGVPTSGLFSGASEIKTAAQAELFGGTAEVPADACFHLACDTTDNIDRELLGELAHAAGWVVGSLASGEVDLGSS
jgi:Zn-dependent M28 family amino/carboxypeptidase